MNERVKGIPLQPRNEKGERAKGKSVWQQVGAGPNLYATTSPSLRGGESPPPYSRLHYCNEIGPAVDLPMEASASALEPLQVSRLTCRFAGRAGGPVAPLPRLARLTT